MIVAVVQFHVEKPLSPEAANTLFHANSHLYEGREDLKRKSYIRSLDRQIAGAIYFWRSLDEANAFYTDEWHTHVFKKYGTKPSITFYESPHVVSNE